MFRIINAALMDNCIVALIADSSRLIRRSFDERARGTGVTRPQWQALMVLQLHEGVNQGGLAALLEVEPITVCRMVDRLQEADLVKRVADPADRRSWQLYLTEKAHALLWQLRPLADATLEQAFDGVSDAETQALICIFLRIRQNLTRRTEHPIAPHS